MLDIEESADGRVHRNVTDPPLAARLFQSSGTAWLWLIVRVWLGIEWLMAGWSALAAERHPQDWVSLVGALAHIALGLALILGAFVGIAAALGVVTSALMFSLPDTRDLDPIQLLGATLLILAWKNAGYLGSDRYLLRVFGAPWWDTQVTHVSKSVRASAGPRR